MARRNHFTLTVALVVVALFCLSFLFSGPSGSAGPVDRAHEDAKESMKGAAEGAKGEFLVDMESMPMGFLDGESIAPKLENATLKYVLSPAPQDQPLLTRAFTEPNLDEQHGNSSTL